MVISSVFGKKVRKIIGCFEDSIHCLDGETLPSDIVSVFDSKYEEVLDNPAFQISSAVHRPNRSCRQ